jgi:hypothetical protein
VWRISKDTEVTALALEMLNAGLPGALFEQWFYDDRELIWDLADRLQAL